ncbi:Ig-like domain-containing protein [Marinobacter maritimus]|uniref:Ig-like domain-containing protein n=1 Tax=Marinobacter maritimus TaxID=277961 RepID=UPI0011AA2E64|nr:Ig-like domain-containing protein [Marinobacter maritimus]
MSGKILARAAAISLTLILAACGGDESSTPLAGGNNTNGSGSDNGTDSSQSTQASSIQLLTDIPSIDTAGKNRATISALVRGPGGVLLPDVPVLFSADQNAFLQQLDSVTGEAGNAQAILTSQGDPRNRTVSVTAQSGTASSTISVAVTGTSISISGPTAVANQDAASYFVQLTDSAGNGIASENILVTSSGNNPIQASSLTTNGSGAVNFTLTASNGGTDTITVSAYEGSSKVSTKSTVTISEDSFVFDTPPQGQEIEIGLDSQNAPITETVTVTWNQNGAAVNGGDIEFSTTRGTFANNDTVQKISTNASGQATVQIKSNNAGQALITATEIDSSGNPGISTQRSVEFVALSPETIELRATRTQISTNDQTTLVATIKDDSGNKVKNARITFSLSDITNGTLSPGSAITDSQGRASTTYQSSDGTSGRQDITITAVAEKENGSTISDTEQLTVAGKALTITIGTGNEIFEKNETFYEQPWGILVTDANGNASINQTVELSIIPLRFSKGSYDRDDNADPKFTPTITTTCDTNFADANNGIQIANPASVPTTVQTDDSGSIQFNVLYPKGECNWVDVRLTATSAVSGFSSSASTDYRLPCSAEDLNASAPPGGSQSKYNTVTQCQ